MNANHPLRVAICILALLAIASCEPRPSDEASQQTTPVARQRAGVDLRLGAETMLDAENDEFGPNDFGRAVAIDGDTVVVGAPTRNALQGHESGSVYVFRRGDAWANPIRLTASDADAAYQHDEHFGSAVAIAGDILAIGAPTADDPGRGDNAGAVYIFARSSDEWIEQSQLAADDAAASAEFGSVLAISGDTLAVANGHGAQKVYVFRRNGATWTQQAKLILDDNPDGSYFRTALALSRETLIVGGVTYGDAGLGAGAVYLFQRDGGTWSQNARLAADDATFHTGFGSSVAFDGNTLAVGAPGDTDAGLAAGAVYLFRRDGDSWIAQGKLTASDAAAMDLFGSSVALQGDLLVVGAGGDDDSGFLGGSAYVFRRSGSEWIDQLKLIASDEASGAFFGSSAAINGNSILIGAPSEYGHAAYVYDLVVP
jgi:hypothetical protein